MKRRFILLIFVFSLSFLFSIEAALASEAGKKPAKPERIDIQQYIRGASLQNGANLYYYGINLWGQRVPITGGPPWLYMHGGGCVSWTLIYC